VSISRIILLTGDAEAPHLSARLKAHNPALAVDTVHDLSQLTDLCSADPRGIRLISFCSPVIVPGAILSNLPGPAYNFHPGPPERPGRYPAVFAIYDNAELFGITVHEMAAKVDAGPIVAAEWFAVPKNCTLEELESATFTALFKKFEAFAAHLALVERPLPRMPYKWTGHKTCKADRDALALITPDLSPAEIARRKLACGA